MNILKFSSLLLFLCLIKNGLTHDGEEHELSESDIEFWNTNAAEVLKKRIDISVKKTETAKNIIIFLGSGISASTLAGARMKYSETEAKLSFESFPWSGITRTYCVDSQVPDSACAATAILTGIKSNLGTIGVSPDVQKGECTLKAENKLESIAKWALDAGKAVGFATTNRVTSGAAAALYANSADSSWESNADISNTCDSSKIEDIASQLINSEVAKQFKVILGGGRKNFIPTTKQDVDGEYGLRTDGRDLIEEWIAGRSGNATYITTNTGLTTLDTSKIDYLLGLFEYDQLRFNLDITQEGLKEEPALISMVHYSLEMLQKEEHKKGFLLFVEDSLINEAHKQNKPEKAFSQLYEYSIALNMANMMVDATDTLILSTTDVGSTLSISGYAARGSKTFSSAGTSDSDSLPYLSLSYANGPAFNNFYKSDGGRNDPLTVIGENTEYKGDTMCSSAVPMNDGVNGGEDVFIFASGPWSYLFSGIHEQNYIPHAIGWAACLKDYCSDGNSAVASLVLLLFVVFVNLFVN